jgi:hypothetical protein
MAELADWRVESRDTTSLGAADGGLGARLPGST